MHFAFQSASLSNGFLLFNHERSQWSAVSNTKLRNCRFSHVASNNSPWQRRARWYSRGGDAITNEKIREASQLRKAGDFSAARIVLKDLKRSVQEDGSLVEEYIQIRAAELNHQAPNITTSELCRDLLSFQCSLAIGRSVAGYNAILNALKGKCAENPGNRVDDLRVCARIFDLIVDSGLVPNDVTLSICFEICGLAKNLDQIEYFRRTGLETSGYGIVSRSAVSLLRALASCGDICGADAVYEELRTRREGLTPKLSSTMVLILCQARRHSRLVRCFVEAIKVHGDGLDIRAVLTSLRSCQRAKDCSSAQKILNLLKEYGVCLPKTGLDLIFNTACSKGDLVLGSRVFFDSISEQNQRGSAWLLARLIASGKRSSSRSTDVRFISDLVRRAEKAGIAPCLRVYNAVISTFCHGNRFQEAMHVFQYELKKHGLTPDVVTYNTLIKGYGNLHRPREAVEMLQKMKTAGVQPNPVTYNTMMHILCDRDDDGLRNDLLRELETHPSMKSDCMTTSSELNVCRRRKDSDRALFLYKQWVKGVIRMDSKGHSLLLKILFECKRSTEAISILGWLSLKRQTGVEVLNVTLDYLGREKIACLLGLFKSMKRKEIAPNAVTYTTVIRNCARAGCLDLAFRFLAEMQDVGLAASDSYAWTALIDGCGRCGQWERGVELFESMRLAGGSSNAVPLPTTATYNAALYAAGVRGTNWTDCLRIYFSLCSDAKQRPDSVTYSAMGSSILRNRAAVKEWDVVREISRNLRLLCKISTTGSKGQSMGIPRGSTPPSKSQIRRLMDKANRLDWLIANYSK